MATQTTTSNATPTKPKNLNGVNTEALFATIGVVEGQPELAKFQFRATNRWVKGTHSKNRPEGFFGAGAEHEHKKSVEIDVDHPAVLVGDDEGPAPVEMLLYALASCLTAGIANIASARGVKLHSVESTVEGNIDLRGILGLSNDVRNGFSGIRITFHIESDASPEKLRAIVEQSRSRSAVFDVLTNGTPIEIGVAAH
jgi:uncharacterized OsmC-like protein